MNFSQERIIALLEKILAENHFAQVTMVDGFTGDDKLPGYSLSFNRITYVVSGTLPLNVGSGRSYSREEFHAGESIALKPFAKTGGVWDKLYESIALVLHPNYMRITHADHRAPGVPHTVPVDFYHLQDTLRHSTVDLVNLICNLRQDEAKQIGPELMHALFTMLLHDMKNSKFSEFGKSNALWNKIIDFLAQQPFEAQTRQAAAAHFKVTESYISRLFRQFANQTFTDFIHSERLKKARQMLLETDLTVDEIAWNCGFQSTSYFIKLFRKMYQTSPGFYRRLKK